MKLCGKLLIYFWLILVSSLNNDATIEDDIFQKIDQTLSWFYRGFNTLVKLDLEHNSEIKPFTKNKLHHRELLNLSGYVVFEETRKTTYPWNPLRQTRPKRLSSHAVVGWHPNIVRIFRCLRKVTFCKNFAQSRSGVTMDPVYLLACESNSNEQRCANNRQLDAIWDKCNSALLRLKVN